MDGIFGRLIVRQTPERDPHSHLYDYDLSTHVLIINDWMHEQAVAHYPGKRFNETGQNPDSILINGKGRYTVRLMPKSEIVIFIYEFDSMYS